MKNNLCSTNLILRANQTTSIYMDLIKLHHFAGASHSKPSLISNKV